MQHLAVRTWQVGSIAGVLFLLAMVWFGVRRSDPTYHGRPLSYWFRELETKPGRDEYLKAKEALVQLRLVSAPRLAKLLDYQEPKLLTAIRANMPSSLRNLLISRLPASFIRSRAFTILREMGSNAHTAIPVLIRLVKSPDVETRLWAIQIVGSIGPSAEFAVPALVTMLKSGSVEEREAAARSLGAIGSSAAKAVPDLLSAMEAKRIPVGTAVPTLVALGKLGSNAAPAIPALAKLAQGDRNEDVRKAAVEAIKSIRPNAVESPVR